MSLDRSTGEAVVRSFPSSASPLSLAEQELFEAVECGSKSRMESAVLRGASLSALDFLFRSGKSCVHTAAASESSPFSVLSFLCELGADITQLDARGYSALHIACRTGKLATAEALLELGKAQYQRTSGRLPAFNVNSPTSVPADHRAAKRMLLYSSPTASKSTSSRPPYGWTPLHFAAAGGYSRIVRVLLLYGAHASLDARTHGGETPLQIASRRGHASAVRSLLIGGGSRVDRFGTVEPFHYDGAGDGSQKHGEENIASKANTRQDRVVDSAGLVDESPGTHGRGHDHDPDPVPVVATGSNEADVDCASTSGAHPADTSGAHPATLAAAAATGREEVLRELSKGATSATWVHAAAEPATGASVIELARRGGHHRLAEAMVGWSAGVEGTAWDAADNLSTRADRLLLAAEQKERDVCSKRHQVAVSMARVRRLLRAKARLKELHGF